MKLTYLLYLYFSKSSQVLYNPKECMKLVTYPYVSSTESKHWSDLGVTIETQLNYPPYFYPGNKAKNY